MSRGATVDADASLEIVVITGLSGSGKSLSLRAFEDMGCY